MRLDGIGIVKLLAGVVGIGVVSALWFAFGALWMKQRCQKSRH